MRILYCGEFDPCGVGARQRKYLRSMGVDFRVAVRDVYWPENLEQTDAWMHHPNGFKPDALYAFARDCDLIVFAPCIAQWWSSDLGVELHLDEDAVPIGPGFSLGDLGCGAARMALFHGSNHLAEHAETYAEHYRQKGYTIAATTLDYVLRMGAEYVPSIVDLVDSTPAPLRKEGEDFKLVHCPSDSVACQTHEVGELLRAADLTMYVVNGEHGAVLSEKVKYHAGYDHVRGTFSINSLENAALGLVNLVGVSEGNRAWLRARWGVRLPWPELLTAEDVVREALRLRDSVSLTAEMQSMGRAWYLKHWNPHLVADRVLDVYRRACE